MQTYDPKLHTITVGPDTLSHFAPGTFAKAAYNEDAYSLVVGASGEAVRVRNANESGRIEVTLMAASPSNDVLSARAALDRRSGQGAAAVMLKDGSGSLVVSAQNAWIVKVADAERGKELGEVTWIFETDKLNLTQGGTSIV